jgi:polar amino acid transport system substrate-binding protein
MKPALYFLILQLMFILPAYASTEAQEKQEYKHCTFLIKDEGVRYFIDDIVKELSVRSNLSFVNIYAPFMRCIQMMIDGDVDFVLYLRKNDFTSKYMDLLNVSEMHSSIVFYSRSSDGDWLKNFDDLEGKIIGANKGIGYFDEFDQSQNITKFMTDHSKQLPKLLESGRIDAYVTYSGLVQGSEVNPKISRAPFYVPVSVGLMAISKKSSMLSHRAVLEDAISSVISDGTVANIRKKYLPDFVESPTE